MKISVLDQGYVELIDKWGSDEQIIEAARMSTGKGFEGWGGEDCVDCDHGIRGGKKCGSCKGTGIVVGDEKLLAYLYNNKHMTPFEMCGMTIEVKAPIFVYREWHRHRTQSYNEMSARYIPLPDENYLPSKERIVERAKLAAANRQAAGTVALQEDKIDTWLRNLKDIYTFCQQVYDQGLNIGIPKEVARLSVPVARYSRMRASSNLRNWLGFLTLRMDSHAQWEIRQYADVVGKQLIANIFPKTWELFTHDAQKQDS